MKKINYTSSCEKTIELLEDKLALKSKQLTQQVAYNSFTLIIGFIAGILLAKFWKRI